MTAPFIQDADFTLYVGDALETLRELDSDSVNWVARHHGRRSIGIELSPTYAALAARRLQQLSLLA